MDLSITVHTQSSQSVQKGRFQFDQRLVLGRGPESPVVLDGTPISREHLSFLVAPGGLQLTDLSSNGTWLNGTRLQKGVPQPLNPEDVIEMPGYRIIVDSFTGAMGQDPATKPQSTAVLATPQMASGGTAAAAHKLSPLEPVRKFWNGFSGLERWILYVGIACAAVVAVYINAN